MIELCRLFTPTTLLFTFALGDGAPPKGAVPSGRPTTEEFAQRDRWVADHFPPRAADRIAEAALPRPLEPGLLQWANLGPVLKNDLLGKPISIAGRVFKSGLYCHAPSRVRVTLPGPGKTLSAVVGIQDSGSVGGSVVFSVEPGDAKLFTSPVMHRGEAGVAMQCDLGGAQRFELAIGTAGDGLSSDQSDWADAVVELVDGRKVALGELPLDDPLSLARGRAAPPFSFWCGDRFSDDWLPAADFEETNDSSQSGRTTRTRTWHDAASGLTVRADLVTYADFPTVEWTLHFKNDGVHDSARLAGILPLDTRIGEKGRFLLHHFVGSVCAPNDYEPLETPLAPGAEQRIATAGGRPTNSDLPCFNLENGEGGGGVIAVVGWAGQWTSRFACDEAGGLRITAGQEAPCFRLHPGEEVASPRIVLQFYAGDFIHSQNVWRRWMVAHNTPRPEGKPIAPFTFVCNGNYYPGLKTDAATELQFLKGYVDRGIVADYWNQDAGWYPCGDGWQNVGTWEVDRTRFPKGIREVSDWLHAHGTGTITWFEPERVAAGSFLADHHPEWIHGGAGGGLLKLDEPACRAWITDRVSQLITDEAIDFYRQDFNIDPLYYWRGADADDRLGMTEIRHLEGYFRFWDELVRRHPKLRIDSCASGGRRNDLETLKRAVPILRSDWTGDPANTAFDPQDEQNHVYGISFWMPYHGSGFMTVDPYLARSLMGPIVGIGVDTRRSDLDYDLLRKLYREIREVAPFCLGDYLPLTPYRKGADAWVAWQFDRYVSGDGLVEAFRRKACEAESITLKLGALDPDSNYEWRDLDGDAPHEVTGRSLMDGIEVTAAKRPAALLFTYRRTGRDRRD